VKLEGTLVNLVPYNEQFWRLDRRWYNGEGSFFWYMGERLIATQNFVDEIRQMINEDRERRDPRMRFGIETKDGVPIGMYGLNVVLPHCRNASLSVMIAEPAYWGGGYGTDALLLIVDYVFNWLDMRRVWLETMGINARAQAHLAKVGFRLEARRRAATFADGQYVDVLMYGLQRDEWPGRAALVEKLGK